MPVEMQIPDPDLEELSFFIFNPDCFLRIEGDRYRTLNMVTCQYMVLYALSKSKDSQSLREVEQQIKDFFNVVPTGEQIVISFEKLMSKKLIRKKGNIFFLSQTGKKLVKGFEEKGKHDYDSARERFCQLVRDAILKRDPEIAENEFEEKIRNLFDEIFYNIMKDYLYETSSYFSGKRRKEFCVEPITQALFTTVDSEFRQILEGINIRKIMESTAILEISQVIGPALAIDWIGNKKIRHHLENIRKNTWIFLDTNILISAICPADIHNIPTNRILRYLEKLDFAFVVTPWTFEEFLAVLDVVNERITDLCMRSEDERMRYVSANTLSPVSTFFRGNYSDSSSFIIWMKKKFDEITKEYGILLCEDEEKMKNELDLDDKDLMIIEKRRADIADILGNMGKSSFVSLYDANNISLVRRRREKENKELVPYRNWLWSWDYVLREYDIAMYNSTKTHPTVLHGYLISTIAEPYLLLMEEKRRKLASVVDLKHFLLSIPNWFRRYGFGVLPQVKQEYRNREKISMFQKTRHALFLVMNSGRKVISYLTKVVLRRRYS